jgi:hypothetical protein
MMEVSHSLLARAAGSREFWASKASCLDFMSKPSDRFDTVLSTDNCPVPLSASRT